MSKRTTVNYLDKEAALHFLQSDPDRILFGYPAGKGRVYRFRYNPQEGRVETFVGAGGKAGWRHANGSWERAAKFSEEKYRTGYLGNYKRVAQRRVRQQEVRDVPPIPVVNQVTASNLDMELQMKKLETVTKLLESVKSLLFR